MNNNNNNNKEMNEEIDDDTFYQQDFTSASEWEMFTSNVEQVLSQWKNTRFEQLLPDSCLEQPNNKWSKTSEPLRWLENEFQMTLYWRRDSLVGATATDEGSHQTSCGGFPDRHQYPFDLCHDFQLFNNSEGDDNFATTPCKLSNWYGLRSSLIVVNATNSMGLASESLIKIILGALYVAVLNTEIQLPVFLQIQQYWQHCYLGVYCNRGIRTNLEIVHLKRKPFHHHHNFLSEILEMFRSKVASTASSATIKDLPISVAIQYRYVVEEFNEYTWKPTNHNTAAAAVDDDDLDLWTSMPFGLPVDPFASVMFNVTWSALRHTALIGCDSYTALNPFEASTWSIRMISRTDCPVGLLSDALTEYQHIFHDTSEIQQVLSEMLLASTAGQSSCGSSTYSDSLRALTEPKLPSLGSVLSRIRSAASVRIMPAELQPLSFSALLPILYYLFPDAEEGSVHSYVINNEPKNDESVTDVIEMMCKGLKSCPVDSLLYRLAVALTHCLQSFGGVKAFSHLWYEFMQELRYRWDKGIPIPGVSSGHPDLRTCLLNQKLQMLNCCLQRKKSHDADASSGLNHPPDVLLQSTGDSSSADEDEFFDCRTEKAVRMPAQEETQTWEDKCPVGRLKPIPNVTLIETGEPVYIPITQEAVPKTEDQIEEDTDLMLQSDAELRARMMSTTLLSDMESFKAANPGCILADFIRWYSLRDWIQHDGDGDDNSNNMEQQSGHLSARMLIEDNFWMRTWRRAKPVAAASQKRHFDEIQQGEHVLRYLESLTLADTVQHLLPILYKAAVHRLCVELNRVNEQLCQETTITNNGDDDDDDASKLLNDLVKVGEQMSRMVTPTVHHFDVFINKVAELEWFVCKMQSIGVKCLMGGRSPPESMEVGNGVLHQLIRGNEVVVSTDCRQAMSNSRMAQAVINMVSRRGQRNPYQREMHHHQVHDASSSSSSVINKTDTHITWKSPSDTSTISLPLPREKEVLLRVSDRYSTTNDNKDSSTSASACNLHSLRTIITTNQFQLIGAFSESIDFI